MAGPIETAILEEINGPAHSSARPDALEQLVLALARAIDRELVRRPGHTTTVGGPRVTLDPLVPPGTVAPGVPGVTRPSGSG